MKKFLAIALIAASFVACNEGEKKAEETTTPADTTATTPATPAPTTPDTTATAPADTAKAAAPAADTTKK